MVRGEAVFRLVVWRVGVCGGGGRIGGRIYSTANTASSNPPPSVPPPSADQWWVLKCFPSCCCCCIDRWRWRATKHRTSKGLMRLWPHSALLSLSLSFCSFFLSRSSPRHFRLLFFSWVRTTSCVTCQWHYNSHHLSAFENDSCGSLALFVWLFWKLP